MMNNTRIETLICLIKQWHKDRNLIDGSTDKAQFIKLVEEVGELQDNIMNNGDIKDDIGDMMVVMINLCERNNLTILECLEQAYNDIKDRKGKMVDGIFVKEEV
jgi:NTP pyrophosphatase (non-canonical NTP hydrolase)